LKPENVLIDQDGYTKLCDFGLSKKTNITHAKSDSASSENDSASAKSHRSVTVKESEFTSSTTFFGTLEYMAPEAFKASNEELAQTKKGVHHQTDLWAFGCVLYEMLVGWPPFFGNTQQAIYKKILCK
jgi:serine/threonine protein kinase